MKKSITLLNALLLFTVSIRAQVACGTAQSLAGYANGDTLTQTVKEKWYSFNPIGKDMLVDVTATDTTFKLVDSVFIYLNSCSSPALIASWGRPMIAGADSIQGLELRLTNLPPDASVCYMRIKLSGEVSRTARYNLNLGTATATACDLITNGDFENLGVGPCPLVATCFPGLYIIPSWQTGYYCGSILFTPCRYGPPTFPFPAYVGSPHSGSTTAYLATGQPWPAPLPSIYDQDGHEYVRTQFTLPSAGKYYVQMFYCKDASTVYANDAGLGMYLSTGIPSYITPPPPNGCSSHIEPIITPQFQNPTGNVILNTNWLPMGGVYQSGTGTENYLTIGNFRPGNSAIVQVANTSSTSLGAGMGVLIDDVSITPLDISMTPAYMCAGNSIQLNVQSCTPPYCTSTYAWAPATGLSSTSVLNPVADPTVTTTYTLTQTITNAIGAITTVTAALTVTVTPATFTWSAGAVSQVVCTNLGQSAVTLTATGSGSPTYNWFPGSLIGPTQPLTVSSSQVYTVSAAYNGCVYTKTVAITVSSLCCTITVGVVTNPVLNGVFLNGPAVINQDLTISGNAISQFQNGEFLIAPYVKITVLGGSQLQLKGAHLYGCSNTMWQGIEVKINGRVLSVASTTTGNTTLIEDAITAVNIDNVNAVPTMSLTELNGAIFNKNYIAVSINNATTNVMPNFMINNVFTSRSLTFTPTQWPNTSTVTPDLRAAAYPTTGLTPPYDLQGAAISNLKNPYSNQRAHIGIKVTNVGNTTGAPAFGVQIGESTYPNQFENFNLFDALGYGIYAENANINSFNNVFQNAQRYTVSGTPTGGDGIYHNCTSLMNTKLNLTDPYGVASASSGNRFWNCYYGVNATNLYQFNMEYALFRSTQASSLAAAFQPGNTGVFISSSRFQYYLRHNSFNNIKYGINIPITVGTNDLGSGAFVGIYAGNLLIGNNYFGAQTSNTVAVTSEYMNTAVSISSPNNTGWVALSGSGLYVQSNNMNRVYRGAAINGLNSYPITINSNSVALVDDIMNGGTQHGIELVNTMDQAVVLTNTLVGSGLSNTLSTLVYCGSNPGIASPSVCCNKLDNAFQGFQFSGGNPGTTWKGNKMNSLGRGLVISSGLINQQGGPGAPTDNQWTNFGSNNGTWTEGTTNAVNSKLYINNLGGVWTPPNNFGQINLQSYFASGNIITTSGTAYACNSPLIPPPASIMAPPPSGGDESEDMAYSLNSSYYRFLTENPTQLDSSVVLADFYDSLKTGSSIDKFRQVEAHLGKGELSQANALNGSVMVSNNAEFNYKRYYQLYDHYASGSWSQNDSSRLSDLAALCPVNDGPCVYQARALYNLVYKTVLNVTEDCEAAQEEGNRGFKTNVSKATNSRKAAWKLDVFPNPSDGQLNMRSSNEKESLHVSIKDVSGRTLLAQHLIASNFNAQLTLTLKEGIYFITISNSNHESISKKLVIVK